MSPQGCHNPLVKNSQDFLIPARGPGGPGWPGCGGDGGRACFRFPRGGCGRSGAGFPEDRPISRRPARSERPREPPAGGGLVFGISGPGGRRPGAGRGARRRRRESPLERPFSGIYGRRRLVWESWTWASWGRVFEPMPKPSPRPSPKGQRERGMFWDRLLVGLARAPIIKIAKQGQNRAGKMRKIFWRARRTP